MEKIKLRLKLIGWTIIGMFLSFVVIAGGLCFIGAIIIGPSPGGLILGAIGFFIAFFVTDPMFIAIQTSLTYQEKCLFLNSN